MTQPFQIGQTVLWEANAWEFIVTGIRINIANEWEAEIKFANHPETKRWWTPVDKLHPVQMQRYQLRQKLKVVG